MTTSTRQNCALFLLPYRMKPNKSRGGVKTLESKFGNDQICDMGNFRKMSRWIQWSKIEFSHRLSLQATRDGGFRRRYAMARQASSAVAYNHSHRRRLTSLGN
jgi:hypothetical protein